MGELFGGHDYLCERNAHIQREKKITISPPRKKVAISKPTEKK